MGLTPEKELLIRRQAIKVGVGTLTAAALAAFCVERNKVTAEEASEATRLINYLRNPEKDEKTFLFIEFASRFTVDDVGYRISNAWKGNKDGLWRCAWQGILLKEDPNQGIIPENTLDDFLKPYDAYLEAVYQIPPHEDFDDGSNGDLRVAFENRIKHFGISPEVTTWIKEKRTRFETGLPTSREKDYGPFKNTRLQRYVVQRLPDGTIRRVLVGDVVKELGRSIPGEKMIPDEALLPQLDLGTGVGVEINKENISIYREVLDKYVAGGEFMDASTLLGRLFVTESGARVIVPPNFIFNFEEAKNQPEWRGIIENEASGGNVFLDTSSEAFIFYSSPVRPTQDVYIVTGRKKTLMNNSLRIYPGRFKWDLQTGLVASDGFKITHQFNKNAPIQKAPGIGVAPTEELWIELDKYLPLGTPQQLIEKSLIDFLYKDIITLGSTSTYLGLDPIEVEVYLQTKSDVGLKSLQILKNAKGEPAFIVQIGGKWGLKPELGNIMNAKKATERLNQIDLNIVETITKKFGLRALTGDILNSSFIPGSLLFTASAAYNPTLGIIRFNEKNRFKPAGYIDVIAALIEESAGIFAGRYTISGKNGVHLINGHGFLADHPGLHKALYLEKWVEEHKSQLTGEEYDSLISMATTSVDFYSKLIKT